MAAIFTGSWEAGRVVVGGAVVAEIAVAVFEGLPVAVIVGEEVSSSSSLQAVNNGTSNANTRMSDAALHQRSAFFVIGFPPFCSFHLVLLLLVMHR